MRLGVLDVGSNTVHLLVVDAHRGAQPNAVLSHKTELRLIDLMQDGGALGAAGTKALVDAVTDARKAAREEGVEDLVAFATSAVRDAVDSAAVLAAVARKSGVDLQVLAGEDEARLTFLAVRRWFGWSAGQLISLDIGGGSLELACGRHEEPDLACSLPLGAGRLTREWELSDPPKKGELAAVREHVRAVLEPVLPDLVATRPDRGVVTSKTFRSLARLDGAAPYAEGPWVRRTLSAAGLDDIVDRLAGLTVEERAELPGVSSGRAGQLLAGAVVAQEALRALELKKVEVCPWALREGVILRRLDWLEGT